jgi:hypothetical protein
MNVVIMSTRTPSPDRTFDRIRHLDSRRRQLEVPGISTLVKLSRAPISAEPHLIPGLHLAETDVIGSLNKSHRSHPKTKVFTRSLLAHEPARNHGEYSVPLSQPLTNHPSLPAKSPPPAPPPRANSPPNRAGPSSPPRTTSPLRTSAKSKPHGSSSRNPASPAMKTRKMASSAQPTSANASPRKGSPLAQRKSWVNISRSWTRRRRGGSHMGTSWRFVHCGLMRGGRRRVRRRWRRRFGCLLGEGMGRLIFII